MARVFAWIALRLTIATAVQDGTAVAPNPFDAPTNIRRERKHTHAESATCYGRRYPDLAYAFCKDECNVQALHRHFQSHGRREGRRFGCEAAPLTAAETAKWKVHEARLRAKDPTPTVCNTLAPHSRTAGAQKLALAASPATAFTPPYAQ